MENNFLLLSSYNLPSTHLLVFIVRLQSSVTSALGFVFFGTITQIMMTAMIKPSDSHSDSEGSDSPQPPPFNFHTKSLNPKPKSPNYQPNIKTKLLSLKNKDIMHRYSPTKPLSSCISQSYPISNTPPVNETCSPPPSI